MNQNAWQELKKMAAAFGIVVPPRDNTREVAGEVEGAANGGGNKKPPEPGVPGEVEGAANGGGNTKPPEPGVQGEVEGVAVEKKPQPPSEPPPWWKPQPSAPPPKWKQNPVVVEVANASSASSSSASGHRVRGHLEKSSPFYVHWFHWSHIL